LATAPAKEDMLIPTPMPPWIIGTGAVKEPIDNAGNFIIYNTPLKYFDDQTILKYTAQTKSCQVKNCKM
jgi:hypothetical protein